VNTISKIKITVFCRAPTVSLELSSV